MFTMKMKADRGGQLADYEGLTIPVDTNLSPAEVGAIIFYAYKKSPPLWLCLFGSEKKINDWYRARLEAAKKLLTT